MSGHNDVKGKSGKCDTTEAKGKKHLKKKGMSECINCYLDIR